MSSNFWRRRLRLRPYYLNAYANMNCQFVHTQKKNNENKTKEKKTTTKKQWPEWIKSNVTLYKCILHTNSCTMYDVRPLQFQNRICKNHKIKHGAGIRWQSMDTVFDGDRWLDGCKSRWHWFMSTIIMIIMTIWCIKYVIRDDDDDANDGRWQWCDEPNQMIDAT